MARRLETTGNGAILYDAALVEQIDAGYFDPCEWENPVRIGDGDSGGRGATFCIRHGPQEWVLRHYHRGGLVGRIVTDRFIWTGAQRTRSFREWELLALMHAQGLPVPRPVAARYIRNGPSYTADLITVRLRSVRPLSARLASTPVPDSLWTAVGACVARFHREGIWHADLNAHNLQIDDADRVWLLDFDRGQLRRPAAVWQRRTLARLHRSLCKIRDQGSIEFDVRHWDMLMRGYRDSSGSTS